MEDAGQVSQHGSLSWEPPLGNCSTSRTCCSTPAQTQIPRTAAFSNVSSAVRSFLPTNRKVQLAQIAFAFTKTHTKEEGIKITSLAQDNTMCVFSGSLSAMATVFEGKNIPEMVYGA